MELMIVDKNGWSKSVNINKAITQVGAAPDNDIYLKSNKIAPVHLQLIYSPQYSSNCMLTNISNEIVIRTDLEEYLLPQFETMEVRDGDEIELGDYRIIPKLPFAAGYVQTASLIDASIVFQDATLRPNYTTTGQLTIINVGDQPDCQFDVTVQGLPNNCYQIDPIPLMFPGAQENVRVRLFHRGHFPQAGSYDIVFTITAPKHYPGEELVIKQEIFVAPVFKHAIEIIDDIADSKQDSVKSNSAIEDTLELPAPIIVQEAIPEVPEPEPLRQEPRSRIAPRHKGKSGTPPVQDITKI